MVSRESAIFSRPVNSPKGGPDFRRVWFPHGNDREATYVCAFSFSFSIFLFSFFPSGVIVSLRREIILILKNENYHFFS